MTLSDRRLLIELGVVLIIKLVIITVIKLVYFSPEVEQTPSVEQHFLQEELQQKPAEPLGAKSRSPKITDKER